jgi:hypothetical protein
VPPGDLDLRLGRPRVKQVKSASDFEALGPISGDGSTITIASQIVPTLRQFATSTG